MTYFKMKPLSENMKIKEQGNWFDGLKVELSDKPYYTIKFIIKDNMELFAKYWAAEEMADSIWCPSIYDDIEFDYLIQLLKKEWFR